MADFSKIRLISVKEQKAPSGMFRAVVMLDSEPYQIGEDVSNVEEGRDLCQLYAGASEPIAVFNDQGKNVWQKKERRRDDC